MSKLCILPARIGASAVFIKFEPKLFCEVAQKYQATQAWVVPPMVLLLARFPELKNYDLSSIKWCSSGGAPLSQSLQEEFQEKTKIPLTQGYGLTETSPTTHWCPYDKIVAGSMGFLLPNTEARYIDPATGKDCPRGGEGELWIRGPVVMKGYLNRPDATADAIVQGGWFRTGDIGYAKGDYHYISDRIKEMIKYKGFQVFPAELEGLLLTHPKIRDAGVISVYSEDEATELPRGYVVTTEPISDAAAFEEDVQKYIAGKVANHKHLRGGVLLIEEIPKSPSGKILRRVLKDRKDPLKARKRRHSKL